MDDLHKMHAFMNDFWQFVKNNFRADGKDEQYWLDLVDEVSRLGRKYNNHPAVVKTICGYLDYLEHEGSGRERTKI